MSRRERKGENQAAGNKKEYLNTLDYYITTRRHYDRKLRDVFLRDIPEKYQTILCDQIAIWIQDTELHLKNYLLETAEYEGVNMYNPTQEILSVFDYCLSLVDRQSNPNERKKVFRRLNEFKNSTLENNGFRQK